jgi:NitT/TauT family transport system permease protein/taurine transport system permease protein
MESGQAAAPDVQAAARRRSRRRVSAHGVRGGRRRFWVGMTAVVVALLAWVLLTTVTHSISPGRFPSPGDVWQAAVQITTGGYANATLVAHVWQSSKLVLMGFAVAVATGVPLGLLMGWSRRAEALINPAFLLIRPIPPLAWIPLAILWLGLGDAAKVFVIWFAAFVPALINSYTGVRNIDPTLVEAARVHGASRWQLLREVVLPAASPLVFTGLRLSLQASWTTLVAAELVGALAGLGHVLTQASLDIYPGMILFAMAWVGLLGGLMTKALERLERRVLPWLH